MKFLLTKELGRLAKWLRILGLDVSYWEDDAGSSLIIEALREERVIITRNHHLSLTHSIKTVFIDADNIKEQIGEFLNKLHLKIPGDKMFTRCIICNEGLLNIEKELIKGKVPDYVFTTQKKFIFCPRCKRVYWQGTHWGNVQKLLEDIGGGN